MDIPLSHTFTCNIIELICLRFFFCPGPAAAWRLCSRLSPWLPSVWVFFFCFFFPRAFFPRLGLSELFYWAASRHWDCFYTGQSPDVQSPKAKSTGQSGGVGGEATGVCGVRGELCKEVTEGGGFAFEIVMGGWVFENEGGGKCC